MTEEEYNEKINTMDKCVEYWMKKAKNLEKENLVLHEMNVKRLDLQKENAELKDELNKAKVIINKWLRVYNTNTTKEVIKESEDFLKEIKSL